MRPLLPLLALPWLLGCPDEAPVCDGGPCQARQGEAVRIDRFEATPSLLGAGEVASLSWQSANAALCTLGPSHGAVPRSGALEVRPQESTTYVLTCEGAGGPVEEEASVTVLEGDAGEVDAGPADAGPALQLGGELELAEAPFEGADGGLPTAESALVFAEREELLLEEAATCDAHVPAAYPDELEPAACLIAAGTVVDSWLVHFQPSADGPLEVSGSLTFAAPILGLISENGRLDASDDLLGDPAGAYLKGNDRGTGASDLITLGADRRTVEVTLGADADAIDQLRVVTSSTRALVRSVTLAPAEAPASLAAGELEAEQVLLLDEGEHTLAEALAVDLTAPGTYGVDAPTTPGGEVAAGVTVQSYLWHLDAPVGTELTVVASATFPRPVLGLIVADALLESSDAVLGFDGVAYPAEEALRGLELDASDSVSLSDDGYTVWVSLSVFDAYLDQLRVLLAP